MCNYFFLVSHNCNVDLFIFPIVLNILIKKISDSYQPLTFEEQSQISNRLCARDMLCLQKFLIY